MRLLAISTSTSRGSAAVLDGDRVLGVSSETDLEGHAAERIFTAVNEALASAGLASGAIEAFACDIGPGSFTGVRVGVSAAKGMALGRGAPLVGVGSLEAMAAAAFESGAAKPDDVVVAALDAKKQELFLAGFDAKGSVIWGLGRSSACPSAAPSLILTPRHVPVIEAGSLVLGELDATRLVAVGEILAADPLLSPFLRRAPALDLPDAAAIGKVAARRLPAASLADLDPALVEPLYVRPPDAKPMAKGGPA